MSIEPSSRIPMEQCSTHDFFKNNLEVPVDLLYRTPLPPDHLPPCSTASAAPEEGVWSKRQLSKVWSTQPRPYVFTEGVFVELGPLQVEGENELEEMFI